MRRILAIALLLAAPVYGDAPPLTLTSRGSGSEVHLTGTLCSAQTATATGCTGTHVLTGVSDQLVADLRGFDQVTFYSNQSTATTYTCDVYTSDNGYDADSGVGQDRSSTSLTETQEAIVLSGPLAYAWIECAAIADNQVTITFVATK